MSARPLPRVSTVEALATVLREQILAGELVPGARLREQHLAEHHDVARHTVRATLRALEAEGIVRIEPNRGAHVARLDARAVEELYALRAALEVEAARLALTAHGGRLPAAVHDAVARLSALCARPGEPWSAVADAHADVHHAIVAAAGAARITAAHAALEGEMRLIVAGLRPTWSLRRMAAHHEALVADLERTGAEALRPHLADGARTLRQAAEGVAPDPSERSNASASSAGSGLANR